MSSIENFNAGERFSERDLEKGVVRRSRTGRAICKLMAHRSEWQGTASELVKVLKRLHPDDRRLAVQTACGFGQKLSGLKTSLSNAGLVLVENERVGHGRTRLIYLTTLDAEACAGLVTTSTTKASAGSADRVDAESEKVERALSQAIAETMR